MRGFLGGVSVGALVAMGGAAMWSLSTPLPSRVEVNGAAPEVVASLPSPTVGSPAPSPQRDADLADVSPTVPKPASGDELGAGVADTSSAARPEIGNAPTNLARDGANIPQVASVPEAQGSGLDTPAEVQAPASPSSEEALDVSTETPPPPVQVQLPEMTDVAEASTSEGQAELVSDTGPDDKTVEQSQSTDTGEELATTVVGAPVQPVLLSPEVPEIGRAPTPTPPPVIAGASNAPSASSATPGAEPESATDESSRGASQAEQDDLVRSAEIDEGVEEAGQEEKPSRIAALPTANSETPRDRPTIGKPVVPLTERNRHDTVSDVGGETRLVSPFEANSEPFDLVDDRPLMSIILIDDELSIGAEALRDFPYPLTFAIDPEDPRAVEKMAERRASGFEVLMLVDLPREASPKDVETAFEVWLEKLPKAVGVLEGVETGFQGNRPLADQVSAAMAASGYGFVTQNAGLNTVQKLAERDGIPSGVVFRDFDGAGQDPRAIRRFLDQAAFRSKQEGAVIMLGRLRPDTISALLIWGLQDRANQVALAPVSASMRANISPAQ